MTFIECAIGCHYLTRQLANPTVEAFEAGIHMLAYMNANKSGSIVDVSVGSWDITTATSMIATPYSAYNPTLF